MNIKKLIFPFVDSHYFLKERWWHRLFVVIYFVLIIVLLVFSFVFYKETNLNKIKNINVVDKLIDYTAKSDSKITNTVPEFFNTSDLYGCVDAGKVAGILFEVVNNNIVCSSDLSSNIDDVAEHIFKNSNNTSSLEDVKLGIKKILSEDKEKRYCFRNKNLTCDPEKIVKYEYSGLFLFKICLFSLIISYIFSLILQFIYYNGVVYIVFGHNKN